MHQRFKHLLSSVKNAIDDDTDLTRVILSSLGLHVAFLSVSEIAELFGQLIRERGTHGRLSPESVTTQQLKSYVRSFLRRHFLRGDQNTELLGELRVSKVNSWWPAKESVGIDLFGRGQVQDPGDTDTFLHKVAHQRINEFFLDQADERGAETKGVDTHDVTLYFIRVGGSCLRRLIMQLPDAWNLPEIREDLNQMFTGTGPQRQANGGMDTFAGCASSVRTVRREVLRSQDQRAVSGCIAMGQIYSAIMREAGWALEVTESEKAQTIARFVQRSAWRANYRRGNTLVQVASWAEFVDLQVQSLPAKKWIELSFRESLRPAVSVIANASELMVANTVSRGFQAPVGINVKNTFVISTWASDEFDSIRFEVW